MCLSIVDKPRLIDKKISGAFLCLPFTNAPGKQPKAPAASLTESTSF